MLHVRKLSPSCGCDDPDATKHAQHTLKFVRINAWRLPADRKAQIQLAV